jgi:1,4-alpha-glucan branching enzyme
MTEEEIFNQAPGFYQESSYWYAIIHTHSSVNQVQLIGDFTDWKSVPIRLKKIPGNKFWYFKGKDNDFTRKPKAGDKYKFRIQYRDSIDWLEIQDPAARQVENSNPQACSIVTISSNYKWHDQKWRRPGWEYYLIYQLHVKRFTSRNGKLSALQQIAREIDGKENNRYIKNLGITAIQLLPINEFQGDNSWGYNGVYLYAVESSYGHPDDLKELVDTAHQNGIAVILDVVYNHIGTADSPLSAIDHETYFSGDTEFGAMFNFGNEVTRHFLIQNLLFLAREYHIDGFRFDLSHLLHKGNTWTYHVKFPGRVSGWDFIKEMRSKIKKIDPAILLIAEELPDNWYVTQEHVATAWDGDNHGPFDSQWCDAFHDNFKEVLKGEHLDKLKNVFTFFGDNWQCATNYTESHDEVGNSDERIAKVAREGKGWEMCQISAAGTILARGIPMIFMGQEAGEWIQFGQLGSAPDGQSWWNHRLNLDDYEKNPGRQKVLNWFKRIFEIRRMDPASFAWGDIEITYIHNEHGIIAFTRNHRKYVIVLNFKGQSWFDYYIGVSGFYKELANSSWHVFNISNTQQTTRGGDYHFPIDSVHIPAYGAVILEKY